jgi:hypothetical protein
MYLGEWNLCVRECWGNASPIDIEEQVFAGADVCKCRGFASWIETEERGSQVRTCAM